MGFVVLPDPCWISVSAEQWSCCHSVGVFSHPTAAMRQISWSNRYTKLRAGLLVHIRRVSLLTPYTKGDRRGALSARISLHMQAAAISAIRAALPPPHQGWWRSRWLTRR